jgi:hypothetical protein
MCDAQAGALGTARVLARASTKAVGKALARGDDERSDVVKKLVSGSGGRLQ